MSLLCCMQELLAGFEDPSSVECARTLRAVSQHSHY